MEIIRSLLLIKRLISNKYKSDTSSTYFKMGTVVGLKRLKPKVWRDGRDFLNANNAFPQTSLQEVAGCLAYQSKAKTIDELNDAIKEGILEKYGDHSTSSASKDTES